MKLALNIMNILKILVAITMVVAAGAVLRAAEVKFALPPETVRLKLGPGAELAAAQCLLCHSADYISTQPRLNAPQWRASVLKMRDRYGAPIQTNKVDELVAYLVQNYGPAPGK